MVATKTEEKSFRLDAFKWLAVVLLLIAGIIANYFYSKIAAWGIRASFGIVLAIVVLAIASQTAKGYKAWTFVRSARSELRKVVWPSRQEAVQTTMIVVVMVVVTALVLWGIDAFFMWAVSWLTGQRG